MNKTKVLVYLDVSIDGDPYERMIFEVLCSFAAVSVYLLKLRKSHYFSIHDAICSTKLMLGSHVIVHSCYEALH